MIENSLNSSFLSKFKDRTQIIKKQGIILLGAHFVSKKKIPTYKLHQNMLQDRQVLNKTIFQGPEKKKNENLLKPTEIGISYKLPVLKNSRHKILDKSFHPMDKKRFCNKSYSKQNLNSLDNLHQRVKIFNDICESRLNRSLIIRY